jgi:hypothetical protein
LWESRLDAADGELLMSRKVVRRSNGGRKECDSEKILWGTLWWWLTYRGGCPASVHLAVMFQSTSGIYELDVYYERRSYLICLAMQIIERDHAMVLLGVGPVLSSVFGCTSYQPWRLSSLNVEGKMVQKSVSHMEQTMN